MKKRLLSRLSSMKGFTMIELLVVIAIIGVLAVAVLSAINPIEQINKGRDTRTRSDAAELLGASERYYTTQEQYPWNSGTVANTPFAAWTAIATVEEAFDSDGALDWLQVLALSNEVKPSFAERLYNSYQALTGTDNEFVVVKDANADTVRACFVPTSQQFRNEAVYKCCAAGAVTNKCADAAAAALRGATPLTSAGITLCANATGDDSNPADVFSICLP
jgi:prepilin-type N-terminal cleavage/methylation domain-containing protein